MPDPCSARQHSFDRTECCHTNLTKKVSVLVLSTSGYHGRQTPQRPCEAFELRGRLIDCTTSIFTDFLEIGCTHTASSGAAASHQCTSRRETSLERIQQRSTTGNHIVSCLVVILGEGMRWEWLVGLRYPGCRHGRNYSNRRYNEGDWFTFPTYGAPKQQTVTPLSKA